MKIVQSPARTVTSKAICNEPLDAKVDGVHKHPIESRCDGELKATGTVLDSYPAQYQHKCDKCGRIVNLSESYPRTDTIPA